MANPLPIKGKEFAYLYKFQFSAVKKPTTARFIK